MTTGIRARLRERDYYATKYPRGWKRARRIIRRLAGGVCQRCGQRRRLEVHHIGAPFANGRPGNPRDKHDIRPENLTAICFPCHDALENVGAIRHRKQKREQRRRESRERHRALGIGTGLVVWQEARPC